MSAILKPTNAFTPEECAQLDRIAEQVRLDHELRLDVCQTIPLLRRGRNVKKRPRTAIISHAMQRAIAKREAAEAFAAMTVRFHTRVAK